MATRARPSALLDTRVIYCGDCLEQLRRLPAACVDLIYIDPPFNSNRNYEVFWDALSEPRPSASGRLARVEDRHACPLHPLVSRARTQAYIDYMRPRCVELARVLKRTGELDFMGDWYPIQVKQKDKVGRPDIDAFEAMMTREDRQKGFFVAFHYSADALREIDAFFRKQHKSIIALTVQEILDEEIAKKLA